MSIYLSIASIEDPDIVDTVNWALSSADNPDDLEIGIAITASDKFYDGVIKKIQNKNVKVKQFDPLLDRGIGKGRNNAKFAYDDQDYIIQVDSHTYFAKGWDSFSIKLFNKSVEETQNNKTLVTGYLPPYIKGSGKVDILNRWLCYSVYTDDDRKGIPLKDWLVSSIIDFPDGIIEDKTKLFYPANKIGADYIVANKEWATDSGLPKEAIFWEEEVLQSINLIDLGFSLAFANVMPPLAHRHIGHETFKRQTSDELYDDTNQIQMAITKNIKNYIENNKNACIKYKNYCGYDLVSNTINGQRMPTHY